MGRLIDEDIVIDIINFECGKWTGLSKTIEKKIKALPPAQPTNTQDILEYLDTVLHPIISPEHWNIYSELHDMISALPSTQAERPRGEWILKKKLVPLAWDCSPIDYDNYDEASHSELREIYCCSECGWESGEFKGGDFCPNCYADMRGAEK